MIAILFKLSYVNNKSNQEAWRWCGKNPFPSISRNKKGTILQYDLGNLSIFSYLYTASIH